MFLFLFFIAFFFLASAAETLKVVVLPLQKAILSRMVHPGKQG
jgi:hypothetical protein